MFRIFGFLPDLFGVSGRSLHILFDGGQFLGQSLQFFFTGRQELGKLFTVFLVLGASDVTSRNPVVQSGDLRTEIIDFGFLTSEFDATYFHDLFLKSLDFGFDAGGLSMKFIDIGL